MKMSRIMKTKEKKMIKLKRKFIEKRIEIMNLMRLNMKKMQMKKGIKTKMEEEEDQRRNFIKIPILMKIMR